MKIIDTNAKQSTAQYVKVYRGPTIGSIGSGAAGIDITKTTL